MWCRGCPQGLFGPPNNTYPCVIFYVVRTSKSFNKHKKTKQTSKTLKKTPHRPPILIPTPASEYIDGHTVSCDGLMNRWNRSATQATDLKSFPMNHPNSRYAKMPATPHFLQPLCQLLVDSVNILTTDLDVADLVRCGDGFESVQ